MFFKGLLDGNINGFPSMDLDWFFFGLELLVFSGLVCKEMTFNRFC